MKLTHSYVLSGNTMTVLISLYANIGMLMIHYYKLKPKLIKWFMTRAAEVNATESESTIAMVTNSTMTCEVSVRACN